MQDTLHAHESTSLPAARILRAYPVTVAVAAPYVLLFIPLALAFGNDRVGFIIYTGALAVVPALVVEFLVRVRPSPQRLFVEPRNHGRSLAVIAQATLAVGIVTGPLAALLGAGTITSQVAGASAGAAASILALFSSWVVAGLALCMSAVAAGVMSRRRLFLLLALAATAQVITGAVTLILVSVLAFGVYAVILLLYFGHISLKQCVALASLVLVVWPIAFEIRNDLRVSSGVRVDESLGAFERLRYDLQITAAEPYGTNVDLGQPGALELVRYGLLPRFLDPARPDLDTAVRINVFLGGSDTSAFSFLPAATLHFLEGPFTVVVAYAALALLARLIVRSGTRVTPSRIVVFGLLLFGPLSWTTTYPNSYVSFVQSLVSVTPVFAALAIAGASARHAARRSGSPDGRGRA